MTPLPFKEYLFNYFVEWEKEQPGRRSSFSAFARWLSENSYSVNIKQQLLSDWIKGKYKPDDERYVLVLAEKMGNEIYSILNVSLPNPFLQKIKSIWDRIPEDKQRQLAEQAEKYETKNEHVQKTSKPRKTAPHK